MEDPEKIEKIGNIEKFKKFKQCKCSQRLLAPEEKSEDSDDNVWAANGNNSLLLICQRWVHLGNLGSLMQAGMQTSQM